MVDFRYSGNLHLIKFGFMGEDYAKDFFVKKSSALPKNLEKGNGYCRGEHCSSSHLREPKQYWYFVGVDVPGDPFTDATIHCEYRFVLVQMGVSGKRLPYDKV